MKKQEKKERIAAISRELALLYPDALCALEWGGDPWKLLIMGRLSAQCTDARVNIVCRELFSRFPTAAALAEGNLAEIEEIVRPCGLFRVKAKSIKEATAMISPVMIIVLLVGIGSSFLPMNEWYFFCIPLLNSAAALGSVFSMATQPLFVVITVLTNLAVAGVLMWVLSRMFCSEKIMFTK